MHLTGDSVHHISFNPDDSDEVPKTWEQLMGIETYGTVYGHARHLHRPDQLNNEYPNQGLFAAIAFTKSFQEIPGLADLHRQNMYGERIDRSIATSVLDALDRANAGNLARGSESGFEESFRALTPYALPDGMWPLQPELHDIPNAAAIHRREDPLQNPLTYATTYAETHTFLRGVTNTQQFVDNGIRAVQTVVSEYLTFFNRDEAPLRWTVNPGNRGGR